jgi:hypothetical protein
MQEAVHAQGGNDLRGFGFGHGQVDDGGLDVGQLQEPHLQLRTGASPRYHAKVFMAHVASDSGSDAEGFLREDRRE